MALSVRRSLAGLAAGALSLAMLGGCAGDDLEGGSGDGSGDKGTVRLSGQNFDEAAIVAAMYTALLEDAGYTVEAKLVDTRDAYMSTFPKSIDVVPEYSGGIANFLNAKKGGDAAEPISTPDKDEMIDELTPLAEEAGLTVLEPAEATDTNAFFVTKKYAEDNDLTTLSDLADVGPVTLAAAPDCKGRPDCEGGLTEVYGIEIKEILPLGFASNDTYQSVLKGESQVGLTSTTDGTLDAQGLVLLEDDKGIQPAQNLVPVVSTAFLEKNPDVEDLLNGLMAELTTEDLAELNARVSVDREKPEDVARDYLTEKDLLA